MNLEQQERKAIKRVVKAWLVTNIGGVHMVFAGKYKGGLPVFWSKKEAEREKENVSVKSRKKIENGRFARNVYPCEVIYYTTTPVHRTRFQKRQR